MNNTDKKYRFLTDAEVESIQALVAHGDITPCSPTGYLSPWTTEKLNELNVAIDEMRQYHSEEC